MTDSASDLPINEADALEQAQAADGGLDDSTEDLDVSGPTPSPSPATGWDVDEADALEQARTVSPGRDEEYPESADE